MSKIQHLPFEPTPILELPFYSNRLYAHIISKRDDLGFPSLYGGNKARMLMYILGNDPKENYDVLVTAGGPCSNFNRACALLCAQQGVKMHLVAYTDELEEYDTALSYKLALLSNIGITRCDRSHVAETIDKVIAHYNKQGLRTKFIYAGGKSLEGFYSHYDAVNELSKQVDGIDHLFIASGTGTSLTGICAGMQEKFPKATIHAISTARSKDAEMPVLEDDMKQLNDFLGTNYNFDNLRFYDNYIFGGYAKYNDSLIATIKECMTHEGMPIDPTYTGKAFYGMLDIFSRDSSFKNKNILFWNTGGIFNLLSTLSSDTIVTENIIF